MNIEKGKKTGRPIMNDSVRSMILKAITKAGDKGLSHAELYKMFENKASENAIRVLLNTLKKMNRVESIPVRWRVVK